MTQYFVPCKVSLHAFHLCVFPCISQKHFPIFFLRHTQSAIPSPPHSPNSKTGEAEAALLAWPELFQVMLLLLYLYSVLGVSLFAKVQIWNQNGPTFLHGFAPDICRFALNCGRLHTLALVSMASRLQRSINISHVCNMYQNSVLWCFWYMFDMCCVLFCWSLFCCDSCFPSWPRPASQLQNLFPGKHMQKHNPFKALPDKYWMCLKIGDSLQMSIYINFHPFSIGKVTMNHQHHQL
jgi:hypothetical protein